MKAPDELSAEYEPYARGIVGQIIKRFSVPEHLHEDLMSSAYIALVESAMLFDAERGNAFTTYAFYRVRGAALRTLHKEYGHQSRHIRRPVTVHYHDAQLAAQETPVNDLAGVFNAVARSALSTTLSCMEANDFDVADNRSPEKSLLSQERRDTIRKHLAMLRPEERLVIEKVYFEDISINDTRKAFLGQPFWNHENPPSHSWISKLHRSGINNLRTMILASHKDEQTSLCNK